MGTSATGNNESMGTSSADSSKMSQTDDVPHGLIIPRLIKDESDGKMSPETHYGAPSDLSETSQMGRRNKGGFPIAPLTPFGHTV